MRTLTEFNRTRVGLMGALVTVLVVGVGQSFTSVPMLFATPTYYAQFTDAGGINVGDKVQIAGVNVGLVSSLVIRGDRVLVGFSMPGKTIGAQSRSAIRTDTFLGRKNMAIQPRGADPLPPHGIIPSGQTTTPYQIYDAFVDVTKAATDWNIDVVKRSLNVLSETFDQTAPHLKAALDGVARFSGTIGNRDEQIKQLLTNADKITRVLGDRSGQVDALLVNANTLLAAFRQRSQALSALLSNVSAVSTQVSGFIKENPDAHQVLRQLGTVSDELVKRKKELSDVLVLVSRYTASLTEAVASGPFFKAIVANLLPYQVLQPWVDAAFKKRGIDPENFWRSAGLPAFRWPDPNGTRLPNGAPPAPPVAEGTPDHPGPAGRRVRTRRTPTARRGREIRCRARFPVRGRSARSPTASRPRWMSRRRRRRRTGRRRRPPDVPGTPVPLTGAPRRGRAPRTRPTRQGGAPDEHHLRHPKPAAAQGVRPGAGDRGAGGGLRLHRGRRRRPAVPQAHHDHGRGLLLRDAGAVSRRPGADHGRAGGFDRQDRAGRRQDASHVALQQQIPCPGERDRVDPQPQPGGLAHHPAVAALHRRAGAARRRRHPDRAHPGARRVGPAAGLHQRHPAPARPHPPAAGGAVRRHHRIGRRQSVRQGQTGQRDPEQPVAGADRAQRGPRRFRRHHQEPGPVRHRAVPAQATVRRAQRQPGPVHRLVHPIRPPGERHHRPSRPGAGRGPKVRERQRIRTDPRRRQPRRRDHHDPATRAARRPGNRAARAAHLRRQLQQPLPAGAQFAGRPVRVPQLRQPDPLPVQRHSGRQPAGLPGLGRTVRTVSGPGSRRHQVQLPTGRPEPVQLGGHAAQGGGLLRGATAPAARIQGHHRPGHLRPRHPVLPRQPRAGVGGRAGNAGHRRPAVHRRHAHPRIAGRAHGWPGRRAAAAGGGSPSRGGARWWSRWRRC